MDDIKYVLRVANGTAYLVNERNIEDFDRSAGAGRKQDLLYMSDVVVDTATRKVIKARYF